MPQITAVTPQKKKSTRYNIFLNGQFAFGIADENLLKHKLKVGENITNDQLKAIIKEEELGSLINLSLNFLSFRPRSETEITNYLAKKISIMNGVNFAQAKQGPLISEVITKLKKYNYVNDTEFAKWWLDSRLKSNPKGPRFIEMELRQKNIDKEIIRKTLESFPSEKQIARIAISKKLSSWKKLSEIGFKRKMFSFLLQRGFNNETITQLIAFYIKKR